MPEHTHLHSSLLPPLTSPSTSHLLPLFLSSSPPLHLSTSPPPPPQDGLLAGFIVTEFVPGTDLFSLLERAHRAKRTAKPNAPSAPSTYQSTIQAETSTTTATQHSEPVEARGAAPGAGSEVVVTLASALRCAKDLASALAHLHARHVIHRDIKETNVCACAASMHAQQHPTLPSEPACSSALARPLTSLDP